jgi:hypothetical protein
MAPIAKACSGASQPFFRTGVKASALGSRSLPPTRSHMALGTSPGPLLQRRVGGALIVSQDR